MLFLLNILFHMTHLAVITVNLFGWMWGRTRKLAFWVQIVTILSWTLGGGLYSFGYCFLTDWHWQVKKAMGEQDLPVSYLTYLAEAATGGPVNSWFIAGLLYGTFSMAILITLYLNLEPGPERAK